MKNVAIIHPHFGIGGTENLIMQLIKNLSKQNIRIYLFTTCIHQQHLCQLKTLPNVLVKRNSLLDFISNFLSDIKYCKQLLAVLMSFLMFIHFVFQRIYINSIIFDQHVFSLFLYKIFISNNVIYYCHFPDFGTEHKITGYSKIFEVVEIWNIKKASFIFTNSKYTQSVVEKKMPDIKTQLLYPIFDMFNFSSIGNIMGETSLITCDKFYERKSSKNELILSVNRIVSCKRLEILVDSYVQMKLRNSYSLVIAGALVDFDYFSKLKIFSSKKIRVKMVQRLSEIEVETVNFWLNPAERDKHSLIRNARVVVYTPRNEHFGIVPVESMFFGTPVIADNSGGTKESILHNVTGYLCTSTIEYTVYLNQITSMSNEEYEKMTKACIMQSKKLLFTARTQFKNLLEALL